MKITQRLRIMLKSMLDFKMGEVKTDKAVLVFDGEELKEGMEVYVIGEDGEPVAAEDGDYTVEDGKVIKVAEGKVSEIIDPEAEVAEENPLRESFIKQKAEGEESYDEKTRKIADAIRAKGFDAWVVEAADDHAVVEVWGENNSKHYRFDITWDEEGNPIVGEMTEVEQEYIPVENIAQTEVKQEGNEDITPADEPETDPAEEKTVEDRIAALEARLAEFTEGLNQIINSIAALEERIAGVEGKLAKVEEPAADPVDETPDVKQNEHKNIMSYLRRD